MCTTAAQKSALSTDQGVGQMLSSSYATDFAETQNLFNNLNTNLSNIVSAGPEQFGFAGPEYAALNSQAINSAAAQNKQVQQAIGEKATSAVPGVQTGVTQALEANAATKTEQGLSNQQANITEKGYQQGNQNYEEAVKQQEELPQAALGVGNQAAGELVSAENVTGNQANQNAASSSSWMGLLGGLAGKVSGKVGGVTV